MLLFALGENFSFLSLDPGYQRTIREARQSTAEELHLFQALFSPDPDNLNSNVFGVSRRIVLLFVLAITVRVTQALYEGGGVEGRFHSTEIVLRLFKMRYSPFSLPSVLSNLRIPGYSFMFSVLFNVVYRLLVRMHQYLDLALVNCEFISPSKIIIAQQSKKKKNQVKIQLLTLWLCVLTTSLSGGHHS